MVLFLVVLPSTTFTTGLLLVVFSVLALCIDTVTTLPVGFSTGLVSSGGKYIDSSSIETGMNFPFLTIATCGFLK